MYRMDYFDLFCRDGVDNQFEITCGEIKIKNEDLFSESITVEEGICSENELTFGCEASMLSFKAANIFSSMKDNAITAHVSIDGGEKFKIGDYTVYSDSLTADKSFREIVAYDKMYDIINSDVSIWYNSILPHENSTITMREFRRSFAELFGIQEKNIVLVNDDMVIAKTITPQQGGNEASLSGGDVMRRICEINGCFARIGRDGKIHYIYLEPIDPGLLPSDNLFPSERLFPRASSAYSVDKSNYINCNYEDYICQKIDKLQIRQEEADIGCVIGTGSNAYVIEGNFLVYGKTHSELEFIANNIFERIQGVYYRPFECTAKGNLCFEPGDQIHIDTTYESVDSYIFHRTLTGIQALRDVYSASGNLTRSENVNSQNRDMLRLKGKMNVLERTVEETKSTISDVEEGLSSEIRQTAGEISSKVESYQKVYNEEGFIIRLKGSGHPDNIYEADDHMYELYLDIDTGDYYQSNPDGYPATSWYWRKEGTLDLISDFATSVISQTKNTIDMRVVMNDEVRSKFAMDDESIEIESGVIAFKSNTLEVESDNFTLKPGVGVSVKGAIDAESFTAFDGYMRASASLGLRIGREESALQAIYSTYISLLRQGHSSGEEYNYNTLIDVYGVSTGTVYADNVNSENYSGNEMRLNSTVDNVNYETFIDGFQVNTELVYTQSLIVANGGNKSKLADTEDYGERLLYCYETPSPMFGDAGHGIIGEDGLCYVDVDVVFSQTISGEYYVFVQPYSSNNMFVKENNKGYFVVAGTEGDEFDWEIKAKQKGCEAMRLDSYEEKERDIDYVSQAERYLSNFHDIDYETEAEAYLENYEKEILQ